MPHAQGLPLPSYAKEGDAGMDLCAAIEEGRYMLANPGSTIMVPTGIRVALPEGYELQIRTRSGLGSEGIVVANSPGTIDSGYRGEIKVLLANTNQPFTEPGFRIDRGIRIAQAVLAVVPRAL